MPKPKLIETSGKIDSAGVLKIYNRDSFLTDTSKMGECEVVIIVKRKVKSRSTKQMGYYFGCVVVGVREGLREIGYLWTAGKVDEFLREGFFFNEVVNPTTGTIIKEPLSLKAADGDIDTARMEEIMSEIRMWAAQELSVAIGLPNEQGDMFDETYYEAQNSN